MSFYLHAQFMREGRQIEFRVFRGSRARPGTPCGALLFSPAEWEQFRPIIIGGMRTAGYLRIAIEFQDGTRRDKPPPLKH